MSARQRSRSMVIVGGLVAGLTLFSGAAAVAAPAEGTRTVAEAPRAAEQRPTYMGEYGSKSACAREGEFGQLIGAWGAFECAGSGSSWHLWVY
ncbi:hypothetical protein FHR81_002074 [Actinoalloteichus hoggarensis]|uniref:Uncharacterized protein n=1 Tax=Actinoalloteichus hoggarensis TaxID=1470176 RepID=A0A221W6V0_9PSEU|nr:hypothetical protein [Actinoalloteichus hoggarensis]ASO21107.1 hypothetical protein AHOG_17410 [Actinoalloteichus hoggarensis]MBB5921036.1 hypothetical protein [Actinoalloteichus hoggarensis]